MRRHTVLWQKAGSNNKRHYVWTIEHIFPQGQNIPPDWKTMMGGAEAARTARDTQAHRLGNLTLTGYNSSLGNKSFAEKRDRVDHKGNAVGYRDGLKLNADVSNRETWTAVDIERRTQQLVEECLRLFPL